jgi:tripartite-type tricarboxylate transporter receptor subunit TctC
VTRALVILVALLLGAIAPALAQTFPTHGVTIISPYQAGGASDIIARALAQKLGETWSQPVVVENRLNADTAGQISSVLPRNP